MKRVLLLTAVALATLVFPAMGKNAWMSTFDSLYGTSGTRLSTCSVCHTSVPNVNVYGADFLTEYNALGRNVISGLQAVEGMDSDSDKVANGVEIALLTFPGDAGDTAPTESATWGAIKALYN